MLNNKSIDFSLNEETICGYKVSKEMKQLWKVELDILKEILNICKKYNIRCFPFAGTLLGIVRHNGQFIPWDDDIDVMMFEDDYKRFIEIAPKELKDGYFLKNATTAPGTLFGFSKVVDTNTTFILKDEYWHHKNNVMGIFVDIFPLCERPNDINLVNKQFTLLQNHIKNGKFYHDHFKSFDKNNLRAIIKECIFYVMNFFYPYERYVNKFYDIAFMYKDCDKVALTSFDYLNQHGQRYVFPKWNKDDIIPIKFYDIDWYVPENYDEILRINFGDYNKYEIGTSLHNNYIFDTKISYKEYLKLHPNINFDKGNDMNGK